MLELWIIGMLACSDSKEMLSYFTPLTEEDKLAYATTSIREEQAAYTFIQNFAC